MSSIIRTCEVKIFQSSDVSNQSDVSPGVVSKRKVAIVQTRLFDKLYNRFFTLTSAYIS